MKIKYLIILAILQSCATQDKTGIKPVSNFQIDRYLGTWYEIARLDHSFEKGCENVTAHYSLKKEGGIKVVNRCEVAGKEKIAKAKAYFKDKSNIASLKVSFFPLIYGNYNVIYLDQEYKYAIIDGGSFEYFWILSRDKKIPQEKLLELLKKAENFGFDIAKLIIVKQK